MSRDARAMRTVVSTVPVRDVCHPVRGRIPDFPVLKDEVSARCAALMKEHG